MNRSFEDELTFVPKLNSLSMKLAGSSSTRTSIMERCPKEKNDELDSSYTFQPVVSSHSSKIVAKLKTGFWERQNLHVKRQKQKLEQGPNTMHREHKRNSQKDLDDPNTNNKSKTQNSFSAGARLHHNRNNNKQDGPGKKQRESPYSKSSVNSLEDKRKEICEELTAFRKKYNSTRPPNFTNSNNGNTTSSSSKNEIADRLKTSPASNNSKGSIVVISPRKTKSLSPNLRRRGSNVLKTPPSAAILTTEDKQQQQQQQLKTADKTRSGTAAATAIPVKSRTEKMDLEHQRLVRVKKIALEALKGKKIFVCNGPYSALKTALRKRGWIEKNFKYASACCTIVKDGEETITAAGPEECQNQIEEVGGEAVDNSVVGGSPKESSGKSFSTTEEINKNINNSKNMEINSTTNNNNNTNNINNKNNNNNNNTNNNNNKNNNNNNNTNNKNNTNNNNNTNNKNNTNNNNNNNNNNEVETVEKDFNNVFSSDSQYGIMSRIVRNYTPTLIWTLRRDDINFRLLQKEQIVNHYTAAWTFTTKTGLCVNLRNILAFSSQDWRSFFPRCYRLCCEEERSEFVSDYRLTMVQSLLKIVVERHDEWRLVEEEKKQLGDEMQNKCYEDCLKSNCLSPLPAPNKDSETTGEKSSLKASQICTIFPSSAASLLLKKCYQFLDFRNHRDLDVFEDYGDGRLEKVHWATILHYYNEIIGLKAIISGASSHVEKCKQVLEQMEKHCPQLGIDGHQNIWILKPGAKSRGRGIEVKNNLQDILSTAGTSVVSQKDNKWVVQKYIERPFLVYRTKFDIRQWFLVTDWNPLTLWFYKDCYIRFCSQEFTLDKFDVEVHLSNNSIQKHFQNGARSSKLPESNMWSSDDFKLHLHSIGQGHQWDSKIYPGMKSSIAAALQCCQTSLEYRKNSFELYGADFMLSENFNPWLIEINSSPALGASTPVTERLCRNVIEDTLKVVLDRRDNKQADVGRFELAFRQPYISPPSYMGCNLFVEGTAIKQPPVVTKSSKIATKVVSNSISTECDNGEPKLRKVDQATVINVSKLICEKKEPMVKLDKSQLDGLIEKFSQSAPAKSSNRGKNVSKLVCETKEPMVKLNKSQLDGLIEKFSQSAPARSSNRGKTQRKNNLNKVKSSLAVACIEKDKSAASVSVVEKIQKAISAPKLTKHERSHYLQYQKAKALINKHPAARKNATERLELKLMCNSNVISERSAYDTAPFIVRTSAALSKGVSNCNSAQTPASKHDSIGHNSKNVMTISIAEVMDSQKVIAQSMTSCMKMKQNVALNDNFESVSQQQHNNIGDGGRQLPGCNCCVEPSELLVEMLCPQAGCYDLRVLQKYQQAHRLTKSKNNTNKTHNGAGKSAAATARPKQYGALDVDDLAGIKQAQNKYQQLFLNNYQEGIRKQLQLKPTEPGPKKDQSP